MKKDKKKAIVLISAIILLSCLTVKSTMAEEKSSFLNHIFSRSLNGWYRENDKWFFYNNNEKATGWIQNRGQWYYLDKETAIMQTGWIEDSGKEYYLDSNGVMKTGWLNLSRTWYYLNKDGSMKTGWLSDKNKWYYLKPESGEMATGWVDDNGTMYFTDSSGVMKTGWLNISGTWYYLNSNGSIKTGWLNDKNKWYYLKPGTGIMATEWIDDNGTWYYTDSSGVMKTGWLNLSGSWYYLNSSGAMKTGWLSEKNRWYYLNPGSGIMATGWINDNGNYYYTDASGEMKTGWLKENDYWYYLRSDGLMMTGWNNIDAKKYYFYQDGKMAVGDLENNFDWYLFDVNGYRKTGWQSKNNKWYYYDNVTGKMLINSWLEENNTKYFLKTDGSMAIGEIVLDGVINNFNINGQFVGTKDLEKSKMLYTKFLDLGNEDGIYMELPNGDDVLIDGGEYRSKGKLVEFLNAQDLDEGDGVRDIEYIINTHPHSDHTAGLIGVFENFKVNNLYYPYDIKMKYYEGFEGSEDITNGHLVNCMNYCYQFYNKVLELANAQETIIHDTQPGSFIDDMGILKFIHPDKVYKQNYLDRENGMINSYDYCRFNNDSAVILVNYNKLQMLLTSDIEKETELDIIDIGLVDMNSIDVLKVGHHAFEGSATKEFVNYVRPSMAIITRSGYSYNNAFRNLISNRTIIRETWQNNGVEVIATENGWNIY